jgi:alcohol dehydrogenase, propanol-preferring
VQQRHLAEALTGPHEGAPLAAHRRLRLPVEDHERLVARLALAHQHLARPDVHLVPEPGDLGEVTLAAVRKQLDLRQPLHLRVASASHCSRRQLYPPRDDCGVRAMVLDEQRRPLREAQVPDPSPGAGQVLVRVHACGVCRTDLHVVDGDLPDPKLPLIVGHQIVGEVVGSGEAADRFAAGQRVGIPWLGWTDGECRYCRSGRENLCERARFVGYDLDGGYAELAVADERYAFPLPERYDDLQVAPLLCAGLIGYRALRFCGDAERLGLYGFGASAHIICQVAAHQGRRVYAVTRPGDESGQAFARELGATWAGAADELPDELEAAIIFAPVGELVLVALRALAPGGTVVCAGIHMTDIPAFPYEILWGERTVRSVANLTRRDGEEFLELAPRVPVRTRVTEYPLAEADQALDDLRAGRVRGAAVLTTSARERGT